jgi:hypothetical protein
LKNPVKSARLLVSGKRLPVSISATGGSYPKVVKVDGNVVFTQPGMVALSLKPMSAGWQPIQVRSLTLAPASP